MKKLVEILGNPDVFLDQIFENLASHAIHIEDCILDHLCYRVASLDQYEQLKKAINPLGTLLVESEINGRSIAVFKLDHPIIYKNRTIDCLELPAPKKGSFYPEGFEHVEFVIKEDFNSFMEKHASLDFDTKGISKNVNPDIRINFGDLSVKFHHHTLEYVIKYLD